MRLKQALHVAEEKSVCAKRRLQDFMTPGDRQV
eukprot:CAMPEP_0113991048 /NCGR_PEP_ID=MMETSP0328-20130328/8869_1 /TAXON_ID=39455 /ORGANISM="Alexandrium minutum" /LENGTH=32 /assembly_acc=CAM_ASM_000350